MYQHFFKRLLDIILALIGIIVCLIPLIIVSIILLFVNHGHVFFLQKRYTKNRKIFRIIKFRTLKLDTCNDLVGENIDLSANYTKVGRFLRKTAIDEIPQLFNILLGQMSFIGPRPASINYTALDEERSKYHLYDIKAGLTGYSQIVDKQTGITLENRIRLDLKYLNNLSFKTDVYLFFKTIKVMLGKKHDC